MAEARREEVGTFWTATGTLMGLRYPAIQIVELLKGVHGMKESTFYQYIVAEGEAKGRRATLLELGQKKFGPPTEDTIRAIHAITDIPRLAALTERLLDVSSWDELLATP